MVRSVGELVGQQGVTSLLFPACMLCYLAHYLLLLWMCAGSTHWPYLVDR
jgi:hypothetical protein